ncbi:MAG TPA: T9SS type A sorting domain-containing protein [Saprospiraceae bacterium]|nr:T9SS type A sorting domain-containing protein [Saprospiraceae bacterium]
MKSFLKVFPFFFLLSIFFGSIRLQAQCPSGGVEIFSQQSVTDFQTAYPNCTKINGDLVINDSSDVVNGNYTADITSLAGLSKLDTITGSLTIRSCSQLPSLQGLNHIQSVGTDLFINENDHTDFKTLAGLDALTSVGSSITIRLNDNLESLSGMGTLSGSLTGRIKITDNPKLGSMTPLSNITAAGSDVTIKRNHLTTLSGLDNLQTIGGFLNVREEPVITDISALSSLSTVGNNVLNISNNPLLTNLTGLENVTSINGDLYISENGELGDCDAVCHILNDSLATGYIVGSNKLNSPCQYLTVLQSHCATLPIGLTYFSSRITHGTVYLEWETSSEKNNDGQFVEKSHNGRDWQEIAWVDGHGTTEELQDYSFVDELPYEGINYYRLKQVDYDGKEEWSHVISTYYEGKEKSIRLYPNPANKQLFIQHHLAGNVQAVVYDSFGNNVLIINDLSKAIDVSVLPEGIYYVQIQNQLQVLNWQKVVVLR